MTIKFIEISKNFYQPKKMMKNGQPVNRKSDFFITDKKIDVNDLSWIRANTHFFFIFTKASLLSGTACFELSKFFSFSNKI